VAAAIPNDFVVPYYLKIQESDGSIQLRALTDVAGYPPERRVANDLPNVARRLPPDHAFTAAA